ncbi:hypothetical protein [Clostridium grantii]|uniref:Uncharacterized protein n=1 Tax=Clostridium grantii DSM 8605 TaxID=1121316 RepID=A0A1M5XXK2_9CLOT|nr:hypothetical protein [Clostridium grantii]SHI04462.1 hypothetical protein SAMN02745207_04007 [Clostridium grantii DSM 8605]
MAGWNLKKGNAKIICFNNEIFWNRIEDFLSKKTTMKNLYKITLIRSLININSEFISMENNIFNELTYEFSKIIWNFKSESSMINSTIYNGVSYEAKQDKIIEQIKNVYKLDQKSKFEDLNETVRWNYIEKTKSVIKTNVIGAIFSDFNEEIYSFNLKNDELFLNEEYAKFFRDNKSILLQLLYYREIEFIKISEKDNKNIVEYYGNEIYFYGLEKNYYELINTMIKNIK